MSESSNNNPLDLLDARHEPLHLTDGMFRGARTVRPKDLTDEQIERIILDVISEVDYDHYKAFVPECSEEPEEIPFRMARLVQIFKDSLKENT